MNIARIAADDLSDIYQARDFTIVEIIMHSNYTENMHYNDIALVKLGVDVREESHRKQACLWQQKEFNFHKISALGYGWCIDSFQYDWCEIDSVIAFICFDILRGIR